MFVPLAIATLFALGIALAIYALAAPRVDAVEPAPPDHVALPQLRATTDWSDETDREFARLSERERCELVFAVASLDDERSSRLLEIALHDSSETVALAAAHVLSSFGRSTTVARFFAEHPGDRTERIVSTLSLLVVPEREPIVEC